MRWTPGGTSDDIDDRRDQDDGGGGGGGFGFGGMRQPRKIALTALLRLAEQSPGRLPKC